MLSAVAQLVWPPNCPSRVSRFDSPLLTSFRGQLFLQKFRRTVAQVRPAAKKEGVGCCVSQSWNEAFL
ncbi:MAG: hypothetical protein EZS28_043194, partial [Streblomastix strix]